VALTPTVSVLIVSWQSGPLLLRCLRSLTDEGLDIVVCDNASTDGSPDLVAREHPHVRLLRQPRNLGFAGGVNAARAAAAAPRLLLLNPDTVAAPGAIARLAAVLDAHPAVAAVAGRLVGEDGRPQRDFNLRRLPTLASLAVDLLLLDHLWPGNPVSNRYYARDLDPDAPAEVEQPAAACLMVRAEVFDRLGGLDESFVPAWWEDVDFCRRLRDAGHRIRYEPSARFAHTGGASLAHLGRPAFTRAYERNLCRYVDKHHGRAAAVAVRTLVSARRLLRRLGGR
jgi:GT2 family glycosyltransferase